MLCRHFCSDLAADAQFCPNCGANVESSATAPATVTASPESATPTAETSPSLTPALAAPPYAIFVAQVLGLGLCFSALAFSTADNLEHVYWRVSPVSGVSFLVAIVFLLFIPRTWRKIEICGDNIAQQKRLLRLSCIFVMLFVTAAAIVGAEIGRSGTGTAHIVADFEEVSRLGKRITEARNAVDHNIPAHIAMYKAIEADVQSYDAVSRRLQAELPGYDERFPSLHAQTARSMQNIEVGLRHTELIEQQIGVARDLELLDPATQLQRWQERMQPLLDAETELNAARY